MKMFLFPFKLYISRTILLGHILVHLSSCKLQSCVLLYGWIYSICRYTTVSLSLHHAGQLGWFHVVAVEKDILSWPGNQSHWRVTPCSNSSAWCPSANCAVLWAVYSLWHQVSLPSANCQLGNLDYLLQGFESCFLVFMVEWDFHVGDLWWISPKFTCASGLKCVPAGSKPLGYACPPFGDLWWSRFPCVQSSFSILRLPCLSLLPCGTDWHIWTHVFSPCWADAWDGP